MTFTDRLSLAWQVLTNSIFTNNVGSTKSMSDLHPEFGEREHVASLRSDAIASAGAYSYLAALGDHASHVWVRKAVSVVMNSIAPLPLLVTRDDKAIEGGHAALDLLNYVNPAMSPVDLWQQWVVDMLLGGEEGWELVKSAGGKYIEIYPRQPHTIAIIPEAGGQRYYKVAEYKIDDGTPGQNGYALPPDEFVLFKLFNPSNPWRGLAPIAAVRMSILIDTYAQAWSKLFFNKGARPDYAVIAPEGTTRTEREEMELKLSAKFGGTSNWFRPIVLEKGVTDIKPLDFRPRDIEWVAQRELARDEIGAIFGVPDEIMGYGRDTYENFDTAHWVLWTLTILSLTGLRDVHLTKFFQSVALLKPNEKIVTDTSQVEALKKSLTGKIASVKELWSMGVSFNEASNHVGLGLTIENGDIGYLPSNVAEFGVEPPPPPAPPPPVAEEPAPVEDAPKRFAGALTKAVAYDSAEHRAAWDSFIKRTDPHEKKLGMTVAVLLQDQEKEVLAKLGDVGKGALYVGQADTGLVQKATPGDVAKNPFNRAAWEKRFREAVKPILREAIFAGGQAALTELALEIVFEVSAPAVVEFLNERNQRFAQKVNETTWNELQASLAQGLDAGEAIDSLRQRVENVMGARIRSSGEAIARTEITGATNGGTIKAWEQSGVVEGKQWLAALDDRTRETHAEAHGQTVGLDDSFEVGGCSGEGPGMLDCAEEVVNCRCSLVAVLDTKAARPIVASLNGHTKEVIA